MKQIMSLKNLWYFERFIHLCEKKIDKKYHKENAQILSCSCITDGYYREYEQAVEAALKYALDNLL